MNVALTHSLRPGNPSPGTACAWSPGPGTGEATGHPAWHLPGKGSLGVAKPGALGGSIWSVQGPSQASGGCLAAAGAEGGPGHGRRPGEPLAFDPKPGGGEWALSFQGGSATVWAEGEARAESRQGPPRALSPGCPHRARPFGGTLSCRPMPL